MIDHFYVILPPIYINVEVTSQSQIGYHVEGGYIF
jgi:hypothetical protein